MKKITHSINRAYFKKIIRMEIIPGIIQMKKSINLNNEEIKYPEEIINFLYNSLPNT
jgi:hypothetical protein